MCGGSDNTTTTSTQQSLPPWLQQNYQNLQSQAQGVAATPYQSYDQARVAPLTDNQQTGIDTARAMQGNYEGDLNTARTYGNMAAQGVAGTYYQPHAYTTQGINTPVITPGTAQAQYAATQYAPQAQQATAQQAQAQYGQAQYGRAQQAGYAQAQAPANVQAMGIGAQNVGAQNVNTGQFDQNAFRQYGSPYQQDVINQTMAELNRQHTIDSNNATSQATLGGAFGGDRAAVQQAEIGRNYGQIGAQALANLNNQNYAQAQQMFTSDQARGLQAQGMNQGANLQAGLANQGANLTAAQSNQGANLQAGLANQNWQGNTGLANMGAINTAQLTNAQLGTQSNMQNAGLGTQASLANSALGTQNSQFNAGLGTQTSQFNAGLGTQNNQFNAAQGNQVGMYNAGLGTQNSQFNTGLNYTGQAQNAANSLQSQQFMAGQNLQAQQLSDSSQQYNASLAAADRNRQLAASQQFGNITGQEQQAKLNDINALMQTGGVGQGQTQQNLDTAYNDFLAQRQYPFQTTSWLGGIYNGTPTPVSSTGTTVTPGPSPVSQIAGAGLSAAALYGMYGGFGAKDGGLISRSGLGAAASKGHRAWTGQPTGYADGGPTQPLSFWGAGPGGVSPALQIGLAIMGGQSPHALTNIGQGAQAGIQAQQQAGMNAAKMKLMSAEGRKTSSEADVLESQQKGLKAFQDAMGGEGGGAVISGKKGMAGTPEMAGLPGGAATNTALPAAGSAPAAATPAPTPATAMPAPAAPAPDAPAGGGTTLPTPAPAPTGGGTVQAAAPAPAAAVPQVGAPASVPAVAAPSPMGAPSPVQAPGTPSPAEVKNALTDFPQLAQALKVTRAGIVSGMGGGHPAVMQMMAQAREALTQAAKEGVAMNSRGEIAPLPGALATAAQKAATEAQARAEGELPSKMKLTGFEKNLDLRNQSAVQGMITRREFGLVPLRGAEERKTQAADANNRTVTHQEKMPDGTIQDVTETVANLRDRTMKGTPPAPSNAGPSMAGFGGGIAAPVGGNAPSPVPGPDAGSAQGPVPQAQSAGGGPSLGAGLDFSAQPALKAPAPSQAPSAPASGVPAGVVVGAPHYNPQQTAEMTGTGADISKEYGNLRDAYTTSKAAENNINMAVEALTQAQSGKWAMNKTEGARVLTAIGIDPAKFNLDDPKWMQIVTKAATNATLENIKTVSSKAAFQEVQMAGQASFAPETDPGANKKIAAGMLAGISWKNKLFEAQEGWRQEGNSLSSFPLVKWETSNPMPAEYQRVLNSLPKFKGEDQFSGKPTASQQIQQPSNSFKQMGNDDLLRTLGIGP